MWLDTVIEIAALPTWRERIARFEALDVDPALTVEQIVADTDDERDDLDFTVWSVASEVLARVVPSDRWVAMHAALARAEMNGTRPSFVEALGGTLGERWIAPAIAALGEMPAAALALIGRAWRYDEPAPAALAPAWPAIEALVTHEEPAVSVQATMLAMRGGRTTPAMVGVLARELAWAIDNTSPEGYDEQVAVEELLGAVAHAGVALREVAPSLVPYLRCKAMAWRAAATYAAIGVGASGLRDEIVRALGKVKSKGLDAQVEKPLHLYASWLFGGPIEDLARATAIAGDSIVSAFRLRQAFEVTPVDDRVIAALRGVADDVAWTSHVCSVLGDIGPRARDAVASIAQPGVRDEAYTPWVLARLRTGVASGDETRIALEPALNDLAFHEWNAYVALAVTDPIAEGRVREDLAREPGDRPCVRAIASHPALGARLLPLIRDYDDLVYALWRQGVGGGGLHET